MTKAPAARPGPPAAGDHLYVGIDVGTSGCRALAIDQTGSVHGQAQRPMPAPVRRGAEVEQAAPLWWDRVRATLRALLRQVDAARVRALAVDGTSGSVLLGAADGRPCTRALMYDDARARDQAARIAQRAPARSGAHGTSSGLAKALWLLRQTPAAPPAHVLNQADWIAGCLCGRFGVSDENNALKLGYDPVARRWPDWLEALGMPPAFLPLVLAPGSPVALVTPAVAADLGLCADTRVVAGTTDSIAAFIAAGARNPGEAVSSLGSTLALKLMCAAPVFSPAHGVYSHRLGEHWLAGGASNTGGAVLLRYFTPAQLDAMSQLLEPERPTGLDYYPLSGPGERFPTNDPNLPPRLSPRPTDDVRFFQGILEGIARIEADGYRRLAELGAPYPSAVRSTGAGAANAAWTRIRARSLGIPVLAPVHEAAAYGAALLARAGAAAPMTASQPSAL